MSEPVKIVIVLEGGVVQDVLSCGVPVQFALIDYDAEGADESEIVQIPQEGEGRPFEDAIAYVSSADMQRPARALELFEAVEKGDEHNFVNHYHCTECGTTISPHESQDATD